MIAERRINTNDATGVSVVTAGVPPTVPVVGADVIAGRVAAEPSAFSKYGGVKISALKWFAPQPAAELAEEEPPSTIPEEIRPLH